MPINNKWLPILIIVLVAVWLHQAFFQPGFFYTQDGELQLARIAAYSHELAVGQFPVRWSQHLNYEYGYPIFNFVYPIPYIMGSAFFLVGFSIFSSLKLVLVLASLLSGLFMYMAIKKWLGSIQAALLASMVYMLAPYRALDSLVRAALGEAVAFIFPPLIIWGFMIWIKDRKIWGWILMSLSVSLLILAHNALSLMFMVFLFIWFCFELVLREKNWLLELGKLTVGFLLGLVTAAFFWLPALWELKYTLASYYLQQKDFHDYFLPVSKLVYKPWGFTEAETPVFIGIGSLSIVVLFIWVFFRLVKPLDNAVKKSVYRKGIVVLFLISWLASLWLITTSSTFVWEAIPVLKYFQTPWRFLSVIALITALMAAVVGKYVSKLITWGLIVVLIILAIPRTQTADEKWLDDNYYINYPKSTTWHNEGTPIWTAGEADAYPTQPFEVIGSGEIVTMNKLSTRHLLFIKAQEAIRIIDNTVYFPGWKAFVDGQEAEIQFQDPVYRGLITFEVPAGEHQVKVVFTRTKIRLLSEFISVFSFMLVVGIGVYYAIMNKKISKL